MNAPTPDTALGPDPADFRRAVAEAFVVTFLWRRAQVSSADAGGPVWWEHSGRLDAYAHILRIAEVRTTSYDPTGETPHDILARELLEEMPDLHHLHRLRSAREFLNQDLTPNETP